MVLITGYYPYSPLLPSPSQEHWLPLVAEQEKNVLEWTACVNGNRLVLCYLQDVKACVHTCVQQHILLLYKHLTSVCYRQ